MVFRGSEVDGRAKGEGEGELGARGAVARQSEQLCRDLLESSIYCVLKSFVLPTESQPQCQ